jgi:hypothetical protein
MNCCICGTVRNCESHLDKIFKNIEQISTLFDDYEIYVYYDVSSDNTLQKLKEYQTKNSKLLIYVNEEALSEYRTVRIAKGRNQCLNYVLSNKEKFPYFIMMDMDCVNSKGEVDIKPIERNLKRNDWDALSFNKEGYYDVWALSIKPYFLSCCHIGGDAGVIMTNYIVNLLKNRSPDNLLKCASAFNGFAIYRTNKFLNCYYSGILNLNLIPKYLTTKNINLLGGKFNYNYKEDCEHRSFHLSAINKNNAKIMISPEIIFSEKGIWAF